MLVTDIRHEFVATRRLRLDALAPAALDALFAEFAAEGDARLTRDGVPSADRRMLRSADLRYHGQSFELSRRPSRPARCRPPTSIACAPSSTRATSAPTATPRPTIPSSW